MYFPSNCSYLEPFECCSLPELGRVRSLALIHKSYFATLAVDFESAALWYNGKSLGKIIAYENTNGEYDGGVIVPIRGFGFGETRYIGKNFNLDAIVTQYKGQRDHFNTLQGSNNYYLAWCTDTVTFITEKPVTLVIGNPIANDITKRVTWRLNAKWLDKNLPLEIEKDSTVFECLNIADETFFRLLEDGEIRETENGDLRILE